MKGRYFIFLLIVGLAAVGCKKKESIEITNEWVSETIPGSKVSACYMTITNSTSKDDVLLKAESENFEIAEFHNIVEDDGVMRMEAMDFVPIKSGNSAEFAPGGMHIMLINNKQPLKKGDVETITLYFEIAGPVTKKITVKNIQEQVN
jgi:hypothetical protein